MKPNRVRWLAMMLVWPAASALPARSQVTSEPVDVQVVESLKADPLHGPVLTSPQVSAEFVQRVADRIIRSSYQDNYHVVVRDADFKGTVPPPIAPQQTTAPSTPEDSLPGGDGDARGTSWFCLGAIVVALLVLAVGWVLAQRPAGRKER